MKDTKINPLMFRDNGILWLDDWKFHGPTFFGGNYNPHIRKSVDRIKKTNKDFLDTLHQRCFRKNKKEIPRLVAVEKGDKNKKQHSHFIFETPSHLSRKTFERFILQSWLETRGIIKDYDFTSVYDLQDLKNYFGKDQSIYTERGIDEMNISKNIILLQ